MDLDFACTGCGRCCHDLRLQLTVSEALRWLAEGREVQVLSQAVPWAGDSATLDPAASHLLGRSAAALSGSLPVRWVVTLVAQFSGPCPNLQADLRCGAYAVRPLVCRIYPAEINPFRPTSPALKACPDAAWSTGLPALARAGVIVDATVQADIDASRAADRAEAGLKAAACAHLGLTDAALIHEGFVVHRPAPAALLGALCARVEHSGTGSDALRSGDPVSTLRLITPHPATMHLLAPLGAAMAGTDASALAGASYLSAVPAA